MAITEHPHKGSVLLCDFDQGFQVPEMAKLRPVVVLSPNIKARPGLCTVVCLSTTPPDPIMDYHATLNIAPKLPLPYQSDGVWIKGDMIYSVGFHRLNFIRAGKQIDGKRLYYYHTLSEDQLTLVKSCVLRGMGLSRLTKHL